MDERAPMLTGRTSFGCVVDNYGINIYSVGGNIGQSDLTDTCESYSVDLNKWTALPNLNDKRLSPSLCMFNDTSLFVFGGYDKNF
jgi:hypothetical protein